MAVLERDARRAAGEPLDIAPAAPAPADAEDAGIATPSILQEGDGSSTSFADAQGGGEDGQIQFPFVRMDGAASALPATAAAADGTIPSTAGMDLDPLSFATDVQGVTQLDLGGGGAAGAPLDLSFLSSPNLFPTVNATDLTSAPPPSLFPPASAPATTAPPISFTTTSSAPDLSSLLSLPTPFPGTTAPADPAASTAGSLDLFGMDFGGGVPVDGSAPLDFDMAALDFSGLGELDMGAAADGVDFEELLRSLGGAGGN